MRVGSLSGRVQGGGGSGESVRCTTWPARPVRLQPWAKAGLIVTASTKPGSRVRRGDAHRRPRGADAVRLHPRHRRARTCRAGAPRWLRLTRSGTTLTGYESADGTDVDQGRLRAGREPAADRPGRAVRDLAADRADASRRSCRAPTAWPPGASATFGAPRPSGWMVSAAAGRAQDVGDNGSIPTLSSVGYQRSGSGFTIAGSGDIAPSVGRRRHRQERAHRRVRRPDRADRARRDVHHRRVPPRADPHDADREPSPRPGADRQGGRDRRRSRSSSVPPRPRCRSRSGTTSCASTATSCTRSARSPTLRVILGTGALRRARRGARTGARHRAAPQRGSGHRGDRR